MTDKEFEEVELIGDPRQPNRVLAYCTTCKTTQEVNFKPYAGGLGLRCPVCGTSGHVDLKTVTTTSS
jgi:hypothetical protein